MTDQAHNRLVFINCPFDDSYQRLLQCLSFTLIACGFTPKTTLSEGYCGIDRMKIIVGLIRECDFSVHDLSRAEPMEKGDLPRFNMPFELGMVIGLRELGSTRFKKKRTLVLEKTKHQYVKVLSDLAGYGVEAHDNDPETLIAVVRNWLYTHKPNLPAPEAIWRDFRRFVDGDLPELAIDAGYTAHGLRVMPFSEFVHYVKNCLIARRKDLRRIPPA